MNENKLNMLLNMMTYVDKIVVHGQNEECDFEAELDDDSIEFIKELLSGANESPAVSGDKVGE